VLSGKGIGNLIALPLQGKAVENGNSVFLDYKKKLCPHDNQWKFLEQIEKIQPEKLDEIYAEISEDIQFNKNGKKLTILLSDQIYLSKSNLPKNVVKFLRDKLNFVNSEYFLKKKIGFSVYNIEKYFRLIQTNEDSIAIPRGFINELCNFLDENQIEYKIQDKRNRSKSIVVNSEIRLFDHQLESVKKLMSSENGVLVAPPGAGKTIIGIELIARVKQPCLILVHKKQIYDQWVERIENFLSIPKREIGQYGAGKKVIGDKVTVAMVQSLNRIPDLHDLQNKFGMIIVDECHHMPAKMFRKVITQFNPYFLYGLTATPERKNNDAKLIFIYLGEILHTISNDYGSNLLQREESSKVTVTEPKIIIRDTGLFVPFKIMTDNFQILSKIIVFDSKRNQQIVDDIKKCVSKNLKCVVLTERKHHVEVLNYYLKREYETIILTGDLTEAQRKIKIKQIAANNFQVLLATGQLIGEGTDFNNLDCLFLAYPFAFSGKLTQYIGRIQRGGNHNKYIYDYRDVKIEYLEKMFKKRLRYYNKFFNLKTK